MRKRIFAFALAIYLICGTIPMSAYAASLTSSTTVYFTSEASYEVVIPSSINLNEENGFQFTATRCSLPMGKMLYVDVDKEKTFTSGTYFQLFQNKGSEDEKKINCFIRVSNSKEDSTHTEITGAAGTTQIVALFRDGELNPILRGYLRFHLPTTNVPAGTYTGQVYFNIYVEDASHYTENS